MMGGKKINNKQCCARFGQISFLLFFLSGLGGCSSVNQYPSGLATNTSNTTPAISNTTDSTVINFSPLAELEYKQSTTEYIIAPWDLLRIDVFRADELSTKVRVNPQGSISFPLLGDIPAAGRTPSELKANLEEMLGRDYLQHPQVSLFIEEYTNRRITVDGEVNAPGVFPLNGEITLLQGLALAKGLGNLAAEDRVVLLRNNNLGNKAYLLNMNAIRQGLMPDPYLKAEDKIIVHRSDSRYWLRETAALLAPLNIINNIAQ